MKARRGNLRAKLKVTVFLERSRHVFSPFFRPPNPDLRYKLKRTASQLEGAEGAYESERKRRVQAERLWEDARREYRTPFVVPAMVDAFERLAQLAGDALTEIDDGIVYTNSNGWEQARRGGG